MKTIWRAFKMFVLLCCFWLLLSGITNHHMLVNMCISGVLTVLILYKINSLPNIKITKNGILYSFVMLKNMIISSISVIKLISQEKPEIKSKLITIKFDDIGTNLKTSMQAAAITMTPGTAVIAVDKKANKMLIHGLDESFLGDVVDPKITKLVSKESHLDTKETSKKKFKKKTKKETLNLK